ncbi:hypothetical protein PoB_006520800 [Plakobranchus ocellatus]|uniref:Uncharacterized protein n=1 Tax=Plakobranchus ocellatus TaxID=259542 RepID=A0AAV4D3K9_9GAST|nr:hypothetical protein PoB_006520800 [Plakobranchus ocellatus]
MSPSGLERVWFLFTASPQQGDLRLSGPPSGQGAGGGARTRDRRVPADLRADSPATVPPTSQWSVELNDYFHPSFLQTHAFSYKRRRCYVSLGLGVGVGRRHLPCGILQLCAQICPVYSHVKPRVFRSVKQLQRQS